MAKAKFANRAPRASTPERLESRQLLSASIAPIWSSPTFREVADTSLQPVIASLFAPAIPTPLPFKGPTPLTATAGGSLSVRLLIHDDPGSADVVNGSDETKYYLSTTDNLSDTLTLLGTDTYTLNLADNGKAVAESVTLSVPQGVAKGKYYLVAQNDAAQSISSADTFNTSIAATPLTIGSGSSALSTTIAKSTLASSSTSGKSIKGKATIELADSSDLGIDGTVDVDVYASSNGSIDGNSILVGQYSQSTTVNGNSSRKITIPLQVPPMISAGSYTLIAQTTDPIYELSTSSSGPALTVAASGISLSETVANVTLPKSSTSTNGGSATLKITNSGSNSSAGPTTIDLYASPSTSASAGFLLNSVDRKISIKAGKTVTVKVPLGGYPQVAGGSYYIVAQVTDPSGAVTSAASSSTVSIAPN